MPRTDPPQVGYAATHAQLYVAFDAGATHSASRTADGIVGAFLTRSSGEPVVILDLEGCAWVDSTFAGWMIQLRKQIAERAGRLVVARCPPACRSSLAVMGLTQLFEFQALSVPPQLTRISCAEAEADDAALQFMIGAHENLAAVNPENERVFTRIAAELRRERDGRSKHDC